MGPLTSGDKKGFEGFESAPAEFVRNSCRGLGVFCSCRLDFIFR